MARGISIHIGLNSVDAARYGGWPGTLNACEFDAHDMKAIAENMGFTPTMILTREATSDRVLGALQSAANELVAGDTLLISYSGHGGQIPDLDGDEPDHADETWVLYDRQILDDELYVAYSKFARGVRIVIFSDSCHSGSVSRDAPPPYLGFAGLTPLDVGQAAQAALSRAMPPEIAQRDFLHRRDTYLAIADKNPSVEQDEIAPCVLLISGCQDNQTSLDGVHNGLFTANLLTVWNGGTFKGSYERLHAQVVRRMPSSQTPRLGVVGQYDGTFVKADSAFTH
ncbi:MAG: caspase family protein [Pseudonocardia sp.]